MPPFEVLRTIINRRNKLICPTSLIEVEIGYLIDLEAACHNYHTLPFEGGLLDQPSLIIEIFNTIRGEKNRYDKIKSDAAMDKITKQSNKK